ncbi:hypothetical protein DNTS_018390 [Danionella cerebrum]|uniref:NTR domain-containing protein n=1 Tax=Danionella cerebrum TaxID=2873325 RepID=A0A553QI22_9TELE|nr:hypothetical protein DNTS_018390 [Danionella translucida]
MVWTLVTMAPNASCCWTGFLLVISLLVCAHGETEQTSGPYFLVTFPAVIESGSEAKLCASLLKPNESLSMNIYLLDGNKTTLLVRKKGEQEFHQCFNFKAPLMTAESIQKMKVEIQGNTFKMTEERKVMFKPYHPQTFIQTDKPIYIPGQTVHFRVVTVDTNFAPLDQQYSLIELEDSQGNRIGQWTNVSSTKWILQRSYELNPEGQQGFYTLKAFIGERVVSQDFEVKTYVLPKFEVTLKGPNKICVEEDELVIEVCAKYTYGQPVPGKSWVKVCRNIAPYVAISLDDGPACVEETVEIGNTGCATHTFNASVFLKSEIKDRLRNSLHVEAAVTEEGTEITMKKSQSISLSYEIGKATLLDLPKTYDHGSFINGKIKVSNYKDKPIPNKVVYLLRGETWSPEILLNLTTDSDGLASFSVNTSSFQRIDISLIASLHPEVHYHGHRTPFFSTDRQIIPLFQPAASYAPVFSELTIENIEQPLKCGNEITVTIKYYIVGETAEDFTTDIVYVALSKGVIVHQGYEKVQVKNSDKAASGTVTFKMLVRPDQSPAVEIMAYCVLPSENVVAGSTRLDVSLQFSPTKAVPGEKNTIQLSAQPGSLCGLSAVDQSVLILESGKRLDAEKIFNLLPVRSSSQFPYSLEDEGHCLNVRPRRQLSTDNAFETMKKLGLKMATNLAVKVPECLMYKGLTYHRYNDIVMYRQHAPVAVMSRLGNVEFASDSLDSYSEKVTTRTVFPETWIWELAEVPVKVPDTITTWESEAFCLSSQGLGLAPPAQLTVFQPFFLELSLPYSIIRGEIFELKATVFNYLSKCIMVKVTPAPSSDYTLKASSDDQYSSCLCASGRKTFKWILTPSVLGVLNITVSAEAEASQTVCDNEIVSVPERGRIDTVTRSLLVQAEGMEKTETYSWLLCPKGESLSEEVDLNLPKDVIEGSARSSVSVIGDVLGRALKNLHGLLRMPYGCGEQNMAVLSPNIYILQYLENTQQLTSAIRERATGFLKSGYQRQLNYKHFDGAYSTFGYGGGNTWLTAFVLRSFGKMQKYTYVDPLIIQSAKEWLISKRDSNGCFIQLGSLFNNRMKGGVNDNVTMTAYVTASLLELETPVTDPVVAKGLSCLKSAIYDMKNTYATALFAYTFSLARDTETRQKLLQKLEDLAISHGPLLHWSQSDSKDDSGDSLSVEISSYVLLAALTADSVSTADLGFANRIVSWLVKQQNAYGGFSSTQDTVVALQALSLYATKVFSADGSSTVSIRSAGDAHHFDVTQENKLLYQEKPLASVPGKYSIEVKGSACVSVQVAQFYNIPTPVETKTLSIDAKLEGDCKALGQHFSLNFTVKYEGLQEKTNMVIVDIKLLSGFTADTSMLGTSPGTYASLVERVESKDDRVILYLKEIPQNTPMTYQIQMKQVLPVKNLKPAVVKVYDYYQTSDKSETEYSFHYMISHIQNFRFAPQVEAESIQKMKVEIQGKTFKMAEERKVMFKPYPPQTFIQTDKPIYIPGQTVVTVDKHHRPLDQQYSAVVLEDREGIQISQWVNVSSTRWILLRSYELSPEARKGIYTLSAIIGERKVSEYFQVQQYVLPKFEVTVSAPNILNIEDSLISIQVCAKYTHGLPVFGKSQVNVCRTSLFFFSTIFIFDSEVQFCVKDTIEMTNTSCVIHSFEVSTFLNEKPQDKPQYRLRVHATVTEDGTENSMTHSESSIFLTYEIGKIRFTDLPETFEPGSVKLTRFNGTPIANKHIHILQGTTDVFESLQNLTTDRDGLASFTFNTTSHFNSKINLIAVAEIPAQKTPHYCMDKRSVQEAKPKPFAPYTPRVSKLNIEYFGQPLKCDTQFTGTIKYHFVNETVTTIKTDIVYIVSSRGVIVHNGFEKVEVKSSNRIASGEVTFKLFVHANLAPAMQILVYCVLPSDNIVASNKKIAIEKCLKNKVSLQFSPPKALPGEKNSLRLSAQPGSLCALSAVDQSVLILKSRKRLDAERIFNLLPVKSSSEYPYTVEDEKELMSCKTYELSIYNFSKYMGLKVATNLGVKYENCILFDGLGLAPPAQLTVFQPFFLELSLPYSIIRGEIFELKATVFNYLSKCIMVKVTPAPSSDYTLKASSDDQYSSCLCASGRKTFKWILTPSVLGVLNITVSAEAEASQNVCDEIVSVPERGRIDTVTRSLLVQAEGMEKTETYSWLLCPKGQSLSEEVDVKLPKDVIEGSARSSVSVIGDTLGRALKNLGSLLQIPNGCGEQNIAVLSSNIYILQYLENTKQLTADIRKNASSFLTSGYQTQLNFKNKNGAYSSFGRGKGSTWLTAFVLRCLGKAKKYIYIDAQVSQSAKQWLISKRDSDGHAPVNFQIHLKQKVPIKNLKPAKIKVYDFYQTTVIRSGSLAKLCMSLLKPEENLQLSISLVNGSQHTNLLQERTEKEIHRCLEFQACHLAPEKDSIQEIQVEARGENTHLVEKRKVQFVVHNPLTIIRTDKPIYNPGQTVYFRIFTMDLDFKPLDETDNRGNRINQWINVKSSQGKILQLSLPLNPEASVGSYQLSVETNKTTVTEQFEVKEYVLPKFEVTIKKPKSVRANKEEVKLGVCGRYTHGRPVPGNLNDTGCVSEMFPVAVFISKAEEYYRAEILEFSASVTEEGTGITITAKENVNLLYNVGRVEFIDLPEIFEEGSVKVQFSDGVPAPNRRVTVHWVLMAPIELTTDTNGEANFTLHMSLLTGTSLAVSAHETSGSFGTPFYFESAHKTLTKKPKDGPRQASQLSIKSLEEPLRCNVEVAATVQYSFVRETVENAQVTIVYLVLSRDQIVYNGFVSIEVKGSDETVRGEVTFKVPVRTRMAPKMDFLAYCVLSSQTVLAASRTFQIEKCFENQVLLRFSPTSAVPGEENILQLSARPGSMCGLSAVDQSVLILEKGKHLDVDKVFNLLPPRTFPFDLEDQVECLKLRSKRAPQADSFAPQYGPIPPPLDLFPSPSDKTADAVYETFKNAGLKVASNLLIRMPHCIRFRDVLYHRMFGGYGFGIMPAVSYGGAAGAVPALGGSQGRRPVGKAGVSGTLLIPEETIRSFFPETWIWKLVEIGNSGSAEVPVKVPDTITTWETEAFCLSSEGLGLAPPAQLTVFQPFFLELSLPYSIIRGEIFELKATVFNYLSKCIMVKVTPAPSSDYTLKASSDDQYSSCLCASGRKTFKWILTPSVLGVLNITVSAEAEASQTVCDNEIVSVPERGRIDTVTRSLRIIAEGVEKTNSQSWLLCPKGQNILEEAELVFPSDMIVGSGRATVSVLGDILGRALKNIESLLRMPYGCGEQNIAVLSTNIYILQYLEKTQQLTSEIREKATTFLKGGYQRQLNYENSNGAYTTFGRGEGNSWLTAFVLRTFGKAQHYVFIDPIKIENSKQWLIRHQLVDGEYVLKGSLFNNRMKDPAVSKGLSFLKKYVGVIRNLYTSALLSYTFSLAREKAIRESLLDKLKGFAIDEGPLLHWSQSDSKDDSGDSLSVEISSYVLLAALTADSVSTADLGFANRIVSWLVKQQNAYGGFSSTQDTVVALQALSLYATKVFSADGSSTVSVRSAGDAHHFDVTQENKLLYQEKPLASVPGKYSIEVKGSACVSVQDWRSMPEHSWTNVGRLNSYNLKNDMVFRLPLRIQETFSVKNLKPAVVKVYDYYQPSKEII